MEQPVVVDVQHVTMKFNLSTEKVDNLKEYFIRTIKRNIMYNEFTALDDVSFQVRKGEVFGLVGLNGSGKSTMLKLVSGIYKPTSGTIRVDGVLAPLIELGAGFDMNLTARENVYLNGSVMGYSKKFLQEYSKIKNIFYGACYVCSALIALRYLRQSGCTSGRLRTRTAEGPSSCKTQSADQRSHSHRYCDLYKPR